MLSNIGLLATRVARPMGIPPRQRQVKEPHHQPSSTGAGAYLELSLLRSPY
jgi:hypothetical protein